MHQKKISKEEYDKLKNANTYTTDEIKIGTWINGKSLYRKVMEFKNLTYDKNLFIRNLGIQNVENYCRCEVYHIYDNMQGFESYRSSSSSYYLDWYISNGNIYIDNKIHNVTNYDYIVILEYTKTID